LTGYITYDVIHGMERNPNGPTQWDDLPDLLLLSEVVQITRHSIKGAYNQLAAARFPIAPIAHAKPYRFPKARVRDWVENGTITNEDMKRRYRRRGAARRRPSEAAEA
jgi:hypothetical protein